MGSSGATSLHFAASKGHEKTAELLLACAAKVNMRDKRGGTPLHRATGCGREKIMRMLLERKADVTAKDRGGENVMHIAINAQHVGACTILMGLDEAESLMTTENAEKKTP